MADVAMWFGKTRRVWRARRVGKALSLVALLASGLMLGCGTDGNTSGRVAFEPLVTSPHPSIARALTKHSGIRESSGR